MGLDPSAERGLLIDNSENVTLSRKLDVAENITSNQKVVGETGVVAGVAGSTAGRLEAKTGGSSAPGYLLLVSADGTPNYFHAENDGTLKRHTAVPTADSDGTEVGAQT